MTLSSEIKDKRPLSPHLQVYKLPYNANMSIIGRGVGIALSVVVTLLLGWLIAIVWHPACYDATMAFLTKPGIDMAFHGLLMFGAFVVFFYLGNGIRHVLWDKGIGVNVKFGVNTGNIVLVVSAILTAALCALSCGMIAF